jgi:hypothetical protein
MSGIWEPKTLPGSSPGLVNFLESPKLPEPGQSESNLGPLQPVTAHESFDAHPLESGALERHLHEPSDDGVAIESSMPPLIQIGMLRKSAPGLVGLCRRTQPVVVDSAEIETADVHRSRPGQHRTQHTVPLCAARHCRKRDRPLRGLRPFFAHSFQRRAQHAQAPRCGILAHFCEANVGVPNACGPLVDLAIRDLPLATAPGSVHR